MKHSLLILLLTFVGLSFAKSEPVSISAKITGAKANQGQVMCELYANKKDFLKKAVAKITQPVDANGQATCEFGQHASGDYAVTVIHDVDSNGELKTNFLGLPKEPVGMSNNHVPKFGPPKFKKAKIQVNNDYIFKINLASY